MVKNLRVLTSLFGFLEAIIYIFGLAIVLSGEQSIIEMIIYAVGYSLGLAVGIIVEQKLAIGYSSFHVNVNHETPLLVNELREKGFGVTVFEGEGRNGSRHKLEVLTKRKREEELISTIMKHEPHAFILSFEPKMFKGGYLSDMMKKRMKIRMKSHKVELEDTGVLEKTIDEIKMEVSTFTNDWKA
jgi:uncharacterized protein YebE (UPF0316 family)